MIVRSTLTRFVSPLVGSARLVAGAGLVLALGAGCGKKEPAADVAQAPAAPAADVAQAPAADVAQAPADAAQAPADAVQAPAATDCVDAETARIMGGLDPDLARVEEGVVELCGDFEGGERWCVGLELATGKRGAKKVAETDFARMAHYPVGFDDGLVRDEQKPLIKLCASAEAGCKDLHAGDVMAAHFDEGKKLAVLTAWDDGVRSAKVYDAASLEVVGTVEIGKGDLPDCTFADFLGDKLLVSTGACDGAGQSWIADPKTGAKVADVGGEAPLFVKAEQYTEIGENTWVFRAADGSRAVVQEVGSGKVLATVDLKAAGGETAPKHPKAWVLSHAGAAVFVEARPALGTVHLASPTEGKITQSFVPRPCAP